MSVRANSRAVRTLRPASPTPTPPAAVGQGLSPEDHRRAIRARRDQALWTVVARWVGAGGICERRVEIGYVPEAADAFRHPKIAEGRAMDIAARVVNHERRTITLALRYPRPRTRGGS